MAGDRARRRLSRGPALLCLAAFAAQGGKGEPVHPDAADAALLEFLAEWEGADPAWLDTMMELEAGTEPGKGPPRDEEAIGNED